MKSIAITKATAATAEDLQKEITKDGQRVDEVLDDITTRNVDQKFKRLWKKTQKNSTAGGKGPSSVVARPGTNSGNAQRGNQNASTTATSNGNNDRKKTPKSVLKNSKNKKRNGRSAQVTFRAFDRGDDGQQQHHATAQEEPSKKKNRTKARTNCNPDRNADRTAPKSDGRNGPQKNK